MKKQLKHRRGKGFFTHQDEEANPRDTSSAWLPLDNGTGMVPGKRSVCTTAA